MITIEEIAKKDLASYWPLHWAYLNRDIFPHITLSAPADDEDRAYFSGPEYRGTLERFMDRTPDTAHMVYFVQEGRRIGCAQYVTYKSEDGKCLLMDFWVFPEFRGGGQGHECFYALSAHVASDGASYFEINVSNERNHRFWQGLGFTDSGHDEHGQPLMHGPIHPAPAQTR